VPSSCTDVQHYDWNALLRNLLDFLREAAPYADVCFFNDEQLRKITEVDKHIGMVYSGMGPDSRVLVGKARKIAQRYMLTYGEPIPTNQLVREIASVMQEFTQSGGVRPFGVSLLIIGSDDKGPMMYQVLALLRRTSLQVMSAKVLFMALLLTIAPPSHLPGGPFRVILAMEGLCHRQEHGERKDFPREALQ
jgi:hypothetical protein